MKQTLKKTTMDNISVIAGENNWAVSADDLYLDLQILMDGCFRAELKRNNTGLLLLFDNGQQFEIIIKNHKLFTNTI